MFVTNWISTTKIQKISEITNFFRHYFLSRTEVFNLKRSLFFLLIIINEKEVNANDRYLPPFRFSDRYRECLICLLSSRRYQKSRVIPFSSIFLYVLSLTVTFLMSILRKQGVVSSAFNAPSDGNQYSPFPWNGGYDRM